MISIYCDGLCEPRNPGGIATWGYVAYKAGQRLTSARGVVGQGRGMTNNVAEYTAIIEALRWLLDAGHHGQTAIIQTDSQLAVFQLRGIWAVKSDRIRPLYREAGRLARELGPVRFAWIPREDNEEADALSVVAYVEAQEAKRRERAGSVALERLGPARFLANGKYAVDTGAGTCTCPDFKNRHTPRFPIRCKHLLVALDRAAAD
jgi:ribonuclease HI